MARFAWLPDIFCIVIYHFYYFFFQNCFPTTLKNRAWENNQPFGSTKKTAAQTRAFLQSIHGMALAGFSAPVAVNVWHQKSTAMTTLFAFITELETGRITSTQHWEQNSSDTCCRPYWDSAKAKAASSPEKKRNTCMWKWSKLKMTFSCSALQRQLQWRSLFFDDL